MKRFRLAATIVSVLGLLIAGGGTGWVLHDLLGDDPPPPPAVEVTVDRPVSPGEEGRDITEGTPSIVGLRADRARQVLYDAGVSQEDVTSETVPYAGEAGIVVSQSPTAGSELDGPVNFTVSEATQVPAVAGRSVGEVRSQLEELGVIVTVVRVYDPQAAENTVVGVSPVEGEPLPYDVELTVAAAPSSVFLATLDPVNSSCSSDDLGMNATTYTSTISCTANDFGPTEAEYLLNRRVSRFEATIGQDDTSTPGQQVRFVGAADGNIVFDETIGYGQTREIGFSTTGALRLDLWVELVGEGSSVRAGWGSARVLGSPEDIDDLVGEN